MGWSVEWEWRLGGLFLSNEWRGASINRVCRLACPDARSGEQKGEEEVGWRCQKLMRGFIEQRRRSDWEASCLEREEIDKGLTGKWRRRMYIFSLCSVISLLCTTGSDARVCWKTKEGWLGDRDYRYLERGKIDKERPYAEVTSTDAHYLLLLSYFSALHSYFSARPGSAVHVIIFGEKEFQTTLWFSFLPLILVDSRKHPWLKRTA